ncbi:MAG: hypothetical protein IJG36_02875 [Synergistaceae bacterium]|nr:hypothetical protein [Synergistaceae bacterium]
MAISGNTWTFDKITLKNKAASEWTSANPTLAKGEIGLENDTGKFKLGDGTKNWTSLPYATMTVAEINTELAKKANTSAIPAVVDNLTSTSTTSALSANQGRALNAKIPALVNNVTTTTAGSALDAVQGKNLNDAINAIKNVTTIAVA